MRLYKIASERCRLNEALSYVGVDSYALKMARKGIPLNILIKDVKLPLANILKQEALASGMDAATNRNAILKCNELSSVLLLGSLNSFLRLIERLKRQPFGLSALACDIEKLVLSEKRDFFIARGKQISTKRPLVMGILNVTPDSFSDGGLYLDRGASETKIDEIAAEGANIIDIGGASSRPYATPVNPREEISRISHAIKYAVSHYDIPVSVDTCSSKVAEFAVGEGAAIINDITGLASDEMTQVCASSGVSICIMHMRGTPENMQNETSYDDIISDVKDFFTTRIAKAKKAGIMEEAIILDVGFGFGKSVEQNWTLLKYLDEFNAFGMTMLAGISRKSMIGDVTSKSVDERLAGTVAANTAALLNGADILRVHDVKEGIDTIKVVDAIKKAEAW